MKRIRLSHSTLELFNKCERAFQLERMLVGNDDRLHKPVFSRGHALGKGIQTYMLTGDMDKAMFEAWYAYYPDLSDMKGKVNQIRTLHIMQSAKRFLQDLRDKYEVVSFNGQPAIELGIKINVDEQFYYVGFIDIVLKNRLTGRYVVADVKGTGTWQEDLNVLYKNSNQVLSYSIGLDKIVGKELIDYDCMYIVCQDSQAEPKFFKYHALLYKHTLKDRLNWFLSLGIDIARIKALQDLNVYPKRGSSCFAYGEKCRHFDICSFRHDEVEKDDIADPYRYEFEYNIEDLIADHMDRVGL
jgi:hypothetical protein